MKKKTPAIILILVLSAILLFSCNRVPKGMTKEVYDYGVEAVEITESFLQHKITTRTASSRIHYISDTLDEISSNHQDMSLSGTVSLLRLSFLDAETDEIFYHTISDETIEDIEKRLASLKEELNLR